MMGWTGPAGDAGQVLVGAAGAPKHGLDALDAARVRCVRRRASVVTKYWVPACLIAAASHGGGGQSKEDAA